MLYYFLMYLVLSHFKRRELKKAMCVQVGTPAHAEVYGSETSQSIRKHFSIKE